MAAPDVLRLPHSSAMLPGKAFALLSWIGPDLTARPPPPYRPRHTDPTPHTRYRGKRPLFRRLPSRTMQKRQESAFDKTPHIVFCLERCQASESAGGRAFHPNLVQPRSGAACVLITHSSPTSYPQLVHFERLALCLNRHYRVAPAAFHPICWGSKAKQTQTPKKASKIIRSDFYPARAPTWRDRSPPQTATLRSSTLILHKPSSSACAKCITLHVVF